MVPTRYQDGIVFHAGTPDCSVKVLRVSGRWVDARTAPFSCGRSFAKHDGKRLCFTYRSTSLFGRSTKLKTLVGSPERQEAGCPGGGGRLASDPSDSPLSGANASM